MNLFSPCVCFASRRHRSSRLAVWGEVRRVPQRHNRPM